MLRAGVFATSCHALDAKSVHCWRTKLEEGMSQERVRLVGLAAAAIKGVGVDWRVQTEPVFNTFVTAQFIAT